MLILFALHNAEEVLRDLPAWGRAHLPWLALGPLGNRLGFAAGAGAAYASRHRTRMNAGLLRLFLAVMILNFLRHIGASLWFASVQPGAMTATLFVLPFAMAFWRARPGI